MARYLSRRKKSGRRSRPAKGGQWGAPRRSRPQPPAPRRAIVRIDPAELAVPEATRQLLAHWAQRAEELQAKLAQYIAQLLEANQAFNLTSDRDPEKQWLGHVNDALINAQMIEAVRGRPGPATRVLDVGSGGGVPGLIFGLLWPMTPVLLIDSSRKKARFVQQTAHDLQLENVQSIHERVERLAHRDAHREQYDIVTTRAVAPLPVLVEWTLPFVKVGGFAFAIKGGAIAQEIKSAKRAIRLLGSQNPPQVQPYTRSDGKSCHLVISKKIDRTPSTYPRRAPLAVRSPL